jgi:hypothetical protein
MSVVQSPVADRSRSSHSVRAELNSALGDRARAGLRLTDCGRLERRTRDAVAGSVVTGSVVTVPLMAKPRRNNHYDRRLPKERLPSPPN